MSRLTYLVKFLIPRGREHHYAVGSASIQDESDIILHENLRAFFSLLLGIVGRLRRRVL